MAGTLSAFYGMRLEGSRDNPFKLDRLAIAVLSLHMLTIAYVATGWMIHSRLALFIYLQVLALIVLQWLLNRGSSVLSNWESLRRTHHWRDPRNPFEGRFFQTLLAAVGVNATQTQINVAVTGLILVFWWKAFFHMIMIPTAPL